MSSHIVKRLLHEYVDSLYREGYVNKEFYELLHFCAGDNRNHLVQNIREYCSEVDTLVSELELSSNLISIDFCTLAAKANLIEEKSLCIGAPHVKNACLFIIQACEKKHMEIFSQALGWLKNEFASTRNKLETCAQMDRRLIRLEQKKK